MSYVTPIYDRVLSDVTTPTAKGMFNCIAGITINGITSIDDWGRVYGNALYVNGEYNSEIYPPVTFTTISTPTTSTDPRTIVTMINTLLNNIELMRLGANALGAGIPAMTTLVWVAGAGELSPTYRDVNQWELTIDLIHQWLAVETELYPRTGIALVGLDVIYNNQWRP